MVKTALRKKYRYLWAVVLVCVHLSCEQGLEPEPPPKYGISGTVHLTNWPSADSVIDLRVVAFKQYPSGDIIGDVLQGKAKFTPQTLGPYGAASIPYELILEPLPPGIFEYIAVAQQFGPNILRDWRAVGIYEDTGDTSRVPLPLFVPANEILSGVDIWVDFRNPPPPP